MIGWLWEHNYHHRDIIGYRTKPEPAEDDGDYVRVKRIPSCDIDKIIHGADYDIETVLRDLGVVKDETPLDRYEREHGLSDSERGVIEAFLKWQVSNG